MQAMFIAVPALLVAAAAVAQSDRRDNPLDPGAKVPAVEFRSAFEGYRSFADQELRDWRKANEEVGAAGGALGTSPRTRQRPAVVDASTGEWRQGACPRRAWGP